MAKKKDKANPVFQKLELADLIPLVDKTFLQDQSGISLELLNSCYVDNNLPYTSQC